LEELVKNLAPGDRFKVGVISVSKTQDTMRDMVLYKNEWLTVREFIKMPSSLESNHRYYYAVEENSFMWGDFHMNVTETNLCTNRKKQKNTLLFEPNLPDL
jgi:hypothetical protein